MEFVILLIGTGFILLACGFGLVFARLISRDRITVPADQWEAVLSPGRFRIFERMLEDADEKFLSSAQMPEDEIKYRKIRVRIFRGYMQQLSDDFNRVAKAVRLLLVASQADRPELAGLLMKQQLIFSVVMMSAECKLALYEFGWGQVTGLVRSLNSMRSQLRSLAVIADPSAA